MRRRQKFPPIVKAWFKQLAEANSTGGKDMIYLATRQEQMERPHVDSVTRKCANCKRPVWVHGALVHIAEVAQAIACIDCVAKARGVSAESIVIDELNKYSEQEL